MPPHHPRVRESQATPLMPDFALEPLSESTTRSSRNFDSCHTLTHLTLEPPKRPKGLHCRMLGKLINSE